MKEFRVPNHADYEIIDEGVVVGHMRVKPSGILWAAKGGHSWHRVSIEEFAKFAMKRGKKQKK